jgi:UDP-GlcNAc3NAcA epimerase
MKILTIVGARPQFIKAAALSRAIGAAGGIEEDILHTGQHYDANMSGLFFAELGIPEPFANLGITHARHGAMTGQMLAGIEDAIIARAPDAVLTYGDTNSTLAGALAASKLHVPCAHVEAGLRSFNMKMPEEVNRIVTDRLSQWLFCPTDTAVANLAKEGFGSFGTVIANVGDIMLDAALHFAEMNRRRQASARPKGDYILATIHRAENTDDPQLLLAIFEQLEKIQKEICPVVIPLHPRTRNKLEELGHTPKAAIIDPVGYLDMIDLTQHARAVVTDSGGLQKEAYFFSRPCVIVRGETEWTELVECGAAMISRPERRSLYVDTAKMTSVGPAVFGSKLYGDGTAAQRIIKVLLDPGSG